MVRRSLADELEPQVTALKQSIDAVDLDRRSAAASHQDKLDAIEDHDLLIAACGRIVSGFYLLARRPDLAKRIRLSLRPRRTPDDASSGDASSDSGPAAGSGGEPVTAP